MTDKKNDQDEHFMSPDTERWVRRTFPRGRPTQEFGRTFRIILLSNAIRERAWNRKFMTVVMLLSLLIVAFFLEDLGSGGFGISRKNPKEGGARQFAALSENTVILTTDSTSQRDIEQSLELHAAGQVTLKRVIGLMIDGQTFYRFKYEYTVNGETISTSRVLETPEYLPTRKHIEFMKSPAGNFQEMIDEGTATFVGTERRHIAGYAISFQKWRAELPDWGTITYSLGTPLPPSGSQ